MNSTTRKRQRKPRPRSERRQDEVIVSKPGTCFLLRWAFATRAHARVALFAPELAGSPLSSRPPPRGPGTFPGTLQSRQARPDRGTKKPRRFMSRQSPQRLQMAAEAGGRTQLAAVALLRLRLHRVDRLSVAVRIALMPNYEYAGLVQLRQTVRQRPLVDVARRISASSACCSSRLASRSGCCWRSCSTRRSATKARCARSSCTRWRSRSSSPAPPGSGSSTRASASSTWCTSWGFTSFHVRLAGTTGQAIFCVVIAAVWQSSGFVMALFLAGLRGVDDGNLQGGADRRRRLPTHLPQAS